MVVVIEPVLAIVAYENVGPAIVVVVRNGHAKTPAVVGHPGLRRHIGKRAVVIVVEQGGVRRRLLAVQRIERRTVEQVDIQPAIVVVVDQPHARAVGVDDQSLVRCAHRMVPAGKSCGLGPILEDNRAGVDKPACCDGPLHRVVNRLRSAGIAAHAALRLGPFRRRQRPDGRRVGKQGCDRDTGKETGKRRQQGSSND
jgi:hypothetical protein